MKWRTFLAACYLGGFLTCSAWADVDLETQDVGSEEIEKPAKETPFSFSTYVDAIGTTKIDKGFYKGDEVTFRVAEAELGMVVYYCPAYTEGARLALSYTPTYLNWEGNPWYDQQHFHILSLTVAGFTKRLDRWFWRTQLSINLDPDDWSAQYTNYDLVLWGRYEYSSTIGLHFGFWAQTGMRLDRVYPIIGADWQVSRKWKLNLVYPVNVSLEYALNPSWSFAIAGRNFDSRFRVKRHTFGAKSLVRYQNIGAELAIKYEKDGLSANIHAGTTLGGNLRVANRHNHHAHNYHLQPSGYVGGEVDVKF